MYLIIARLRYKYNRTGKYFPQRAILTSTMEQLLILISRAAKLREQRRHAYEIADAEWRALIREAFQQGITGERIAEAAGISAPRTFQIRDGRR